MTKKNRILCWIATRWLALGMLSTGAVQLSKMDEEVASIRQMGYPIYLLTILGIWKILGVIAVLVLKFPLIKEWAYAGFFFAMSGATISRIASGNTINEIALLLSLLTLTVVFWYFRPADRKLMALKSIHE